MDLFFYHDVTEFHEVALTPPCFPSRNITKNSKTYSSPMRDVFIEQPHVKIEALSPLPFPGKIRLLFAIFGLFLPGNRVGSPVKGLESKLDKTYFIHTVPVNFL